MNVQNAVAQMQQRAAAGDAEALFTLANWRLFGMYGARDLGAMHSYLQRAAERGHGEARRQRAYLIANGTGCLPDFETARAIIETAAADDPISARQIELLRQMPPSPSARDREIRCGDPRVETIAGLFSPEECRYLISRAEPEMRLSQVVDPATGGMMPDPVRTSHGMNFGPWMEDLVVQALGRRLGEATGTDPRCGEPLHILRYRPGQEYRVHLDGLPGVANPRTQTALVYLNEGYDGGATRFPALDLEIKGAVGDALIFANVGPDQRPDPRTAHAGLPVTTSEKWLASRWIRARPFDPWAP